MTDRPLPRLVQRLGVRARLTLVAVLVVGVVLAVGGWALVWLSGNRIEDAIVDGAEARMESLVAFVAAGAVEDPLPSRDAELVAQVIDGRGQVVAADRILSGIPALAEPGLAVGESRKYSAQDLIEPFEGGELEDEGPYVVLLQGVELTDGPGLVLVASSLEPAANARRAVIPVLGAGLPLLLVVLAGVTWLLAGRALRPVDRMRAEAVGISATGLDRRLPVPVPRDEIRALAESLNDMLGRLEAAMARQRQFVADASHELKSPLAALRAIIDVALDDPDADVREQARRDLAGEVDRMELLVSGLLVLASSDEGRAPGRRVEVDLDQVTGREVEAATRRSSVTVDASRLGAARVLGDPDRLARLVRNLVDNALRHAATRVDVVLDVAGGEARLAVSDDGPGVSPADRERIFERFVRLDEARDRDAGGAGLGLAVARAIARSHGGDVTVADGSGTGVRFEARLPALG